MLCLYYQAPSVRILETKGNASTQPHSLTVKDNGLWVSIRAVNLVHAKSIGNEEKD
jgi:hypothetical protein